MNRLRSRVGGLQYALTVIRWLLATSQLNVDEMRYEGRPFKDWEAHDANWEWYNHWGRSYQLLLVVFKGMEPYVTRARGMINLPTSCILKVSPWSRNNSRARGANLLIK
jgi:hypothetical protein